MDFERPVVLSMLIEACAQWEATRAELDAVKRQLKEVCEALADAGVVVRRLPAPAVEQPDGLGQARLDDAAP